MPKMNVELSQGDAARPDTQLEAIRDLMLAAAFRGTWLTLGEIAEFTEFGEASISAQLRHLRKRRFGCYGVEKRRRQNGRPDGVPEGAAKSEAIVWEYRVLPPR
jgi:hypothetical protein